MGSIENNFNDLKIKHHEGNSHIKIKLSIGIKFLPALHGPLAIVDCGSCDNKYKKALTYFRTYFIMENERLECECGNVDRITYSNKKIRISPF